jgi:hypothetical protein
MTSTLGLLASSASEADWLMIGWTVIALSFGINCNLAIVNSSKPFALDTTRVNDDLLTLSLGTNHAYASALRAGNSGHRRLSRP